MKPPILILEQQSWRGGAQRVLEEVMEALRDDFLTVVEFPEDGPFAAELRRRGVRTELYPLGRYRSGPKPRREQPEFVLRTIASAVVLVRRIVERRVRLVYINGTRCLPAGVLAARLTGRPSLFHLHLTLTRRPDLTVARWAARSVNQIVACSRTAAAALVGDSEQLARKTQVVYNPVRPPVFGAQPDSAESAAPLETAGGPVIGLVARITPAKGQHVLVRAAARLRTRWPRLQVVFVGAPAPGNSQDASYLHDLRSRVRELGLEANVQWGGYQNDLRPYYASFDVLVIPSTADFEGLPMVALEAMSWGIPVIASATGGIGEVVHDGVNGFLLPPGDEVALAAALESLLSAGAVKARFRAAARATIDERFSSEAFGQTLRALVSSLVSPGGASHRYPQAPKSVVRT